MRIVGRDNVVTSVDYKCGSCAMSYCDYKQLVEHLYWRHGTESYCCKQCTLKRWHYAAHICNVLPIDENYVHEDTTSYCTDRETEFCFCGKYITDAKMIGCDGPKCTLKWYHFKCVGIVIPPDGDWLCPQCTISQGWYVSAHISCRRWEVSAGCTSQSTVAPDLTTAIF